jgi:hypothetical protein
MDQDQTLPLLIFGRLCELKEPVMTVRPSTIITLLCEMAWGESTKAETLVCSKKSRPNTLAARCSVRGLSDAKSGDYSLS